jgi:uncharacterized iron-regulated membrane protein
LRPNAFRRGLQTAHLWLGLILALPIIVIGLTGSVLLLQRESLALAIPPAMAQGERQPLMRVIETAKAAAPDATRMGRIDFRDGQPVSVQFDTAERPPRTVAIYIDPVSLGILGPPAGITRGPLIRSIVQLHEFLWLPPILGLKVVGWMGVAMTLMGISGLILWWPRGSWRNALWIRRGARGLRLQIDLHHVAGFWGSAIFLVMSVSGMYLTFPETISTALGKVLPATLASGAPVPGFVQPHGAVDADGAVAIAEMAVAQAKPVAIQWPDRAGRPVVVYMDSEGFGPTVPPILVTLNPDTSEIGYIDDPRAYGMRDKVLNWQYALHFAVGVPWLWKMLVFLSGLLPLFLAVTGASIWWMKRRTARETSGANPGGLTQPAE